MSDYMPNITPDSADYWRSEAQRYAQNADHWREKYEAAQRRIAELEAQTKDDAEDAAKWEHFCATGYPRALFGDSVSSSYNTIVGWLVRINGVNIRYETADAAIDAARERGNG